MGAYPLPLWDGKLLRIACPHCEEYHYHLVRGSGFDNVREANCLRKNLPKKLRGQRLYYRIRPQRPHRQRGDRPVPESCPMSERTEA